MSWKKRFLHTLAEKHVKPCPNCGAWLRHGKLRILPFRRYPDGSVHPIPGKVFTKGFLREIRARMETVTLCQLAQKLRPDKGAHIMDCPKCKGIGFLNTKESRFLQQLADSKEFLLFDNKAKEYDPRFGDDRICECGHPYYRHFDTYENMSPVGCKYCGCNCFKEKRRKK